MNAQPESSETNRFSLSTRPGSDDSDEDTSQEEQPIMCWNDLSIIERVGLNSLEMSEKDVEVAFCQITMAFRCDQYTLKQRLQAEEHARNLAEENVQLELARGKETLEMLKALCLDDKRSKILQKLELCLDILGGTVERISSTAEVLGAVHQEARVSRAVELMVAHVENLRSRYERNLAELEEARKQIQQKNTCRNIVYTRASPDPEDRNDSQKTPKQACLRRRVSSSVISIVSSQTHEKRKRESRRHGGSSSKKSSSSCPSPCPSSESSFCVFTNDSCSADDRTRENNQNTNESPAAAPPDPKPETPTKPVTSTNTQSKNSTLETLKQRPKGQAALLKKRADKKSPNTNQQIPTETCGSHCKGPGTWRMYRCRWALVCLYISVLLSFVTMIYFLLILYEESD